MTAALTDPTIITRSCLVPTNNQRVMAWRHRAGEPGMSNAVFPRHNRPTAFQAMRRSLPSHQTQAASPTSAGGHP